MSRNREKSEETQQDFWNVWWFHGWIKYEVGWEGIEDERNPRFSIVAYFPLNVSNLSTVLQTTTCSRPSSLLFNQLVAHWFPVMLVSHLFHIILLVQKIRRVFVPNNLVTVLVFELTANYNQYVNISSCLSWNLIEATISLPNSWADETCDKSQKMQFTLKHTKVVIFLDQRRWQK